MFDFIVTGPLLPTSKRIYIDIVLDDKSEIEYSIDWRTGKTKVHYSINEGDNFLNFGLPTTKAF